MSRAIASFAYCFGLVAASLSSACSAGGAKQDASGSSGAAGTSTGSGGSIGVSGSGGSGNLPPLTRTCGMGMCADFPEAPLRDGDAPENAPALFGEPGNMTEGGICLIEPQDDTLFPANWIRPRFRFSASGGEDLFEIRLQTKYEKYDLVVYTTNTLWTMPRDIWEGLSQNAFDEPVTVTIRGLKTSASAGTTPVGATAKFTIAPVYAEGAMVYWAANGPYSAGGRTWLVGFSPGEEGTVDALTADQVQEFPVLDESGMLKPTETFGDVTYPEGKVRCIGCHSSTPDGDAVAFTDSWPWNSVLASVRADDTGARPAYVSEAGALMALQPWLGAPTFSPAHWADGDRIMLTSFGNPTGVGWPGGNPFNATNQDRLAWMDLGSSASVPPREPSDAVALNAAMAELEGTSFGFLERAGDPRAAVNPTWSHDGSTIAYTSTSLSADGHAGGTIGTPIQSDIYVVPYNDRKGGDAMPLMGAADPTAVEYYPDYSADDQFIAFTRAPSSQGRVYYRPDGEVFVVPASGGMARRLVANDPPACGGQVSPGVINSWPKWSPAVSSANGKSYYWLIFSSGRAYPEQFEAPKDDYSPPDTHSSQLYIAGIVVQGSQIISDHPAVYIWNQSKDTTNLTPAWDDFQIPPAIVK
ncbi:MAG TPA: hypothetical protein VM686_12850 [Polyangiaceae bacterium]|nr:hypothetical protein [Polyangiaceae bacterium]